MADFITSHEEWLPEYRKNKYAIWIRVVLSNGQEIYFSDYNIWYDIKSKCEGEKLSINCVKLQYSSNVVEIDTSDNDAVYVVRSLKGQIGGETSHYYTVGILRGDVVYKSMWLTPEMIAEEKEEDTLDNCFEEAIIYNHARTTNRQE